MLKIRRSRDRLIFNMGIPIPGKYGLYIDTEPRSKHFVSNIRRLHNNTHLGVKNECCYLCTVDVSKILALQATVPVQVIIMRTMKQNKLSADFIVAY